MKKPITLVLAWTLFCSGAFAQTTVYRAPGADFSQYRESMAGNAFRRTPMEVMAARLKNAELPAQLQRSLDEALSLAAADPARTKAAYQAVLEKAAGEPRTLAVRETMKSLLERLLPLAQDEERQAYQNQKSALEKADRSEPRSWSQAPSLLQKEIKAAMSLLQSRPGGEDAALFFNGALWSEALELEAQDSGQWILLSSQWKPRLVSGAWTDARSRFEAAPEDWVRGSCERPEIQDLGFAPSESMAFFDFACQGAGPSQAPVYHDTTFAARTSFDAKKTLMWSVIAVGLGVLALSVSGKKLRINSN